MEPATLWLYLKLAALGLGLAASSGFRVFVPLLAASVAHRLGWLPASPDFAWLGSTPALATLAGATVLELVGYYVPYVDHLLDTLTTPASLVAGALLMTSSLTHLDPVARWTLGIVVGGSAAGVVQAGTALLRAGSTATTGGLANPLLATGENLLAVAGSVLALALPLLAAGLALGLFLFIGTRWRRWQQRRATRRAAVATAGPVPLPGRPA